MLSAVVPPLAPAGDSFFGKLAKATKLAFDSALGGTYQAAKVVLNPRDILTPGPVGKAIIKTADSASNSINAAGTGIEKGFKWATLVIVLIVGLWVWSLVRPPR